MNAAIPTVLALLAYFLGYRFYSKFLANKIFCLDEKQVTPAHGLNDGIDYVPTPKMVLFGHHYASIAGLAPMLGPAVAVIWGWFPAMMWVVFGALFVGCVHDFGSMVVSLRARGMSIGKVAEGIIGKRAKTLFHFVIFFLVALAMGVFIYVIAFLFSPAPIPAQADIHFPQAVIPSFGLMLIAASIGWLGYRKKISWNLLTPAGFSLLLLLVFISKNETILSATGLNNPQLAPAVFGWSMILLVYAFLASVLPVWSLLQPRDFLNSLLLYLGLGSLYIGFFILQPEFVAPAVRLHPQGAPSLFPFVFIIIACGAASGFHSLVASGTTAKQLNKETDARFIGFGGMVGESMLA
jgi:carbon starvation protein